MEGFIRGFFLGTLAGLGLSMIIAVSIDLRYQEGSISRGYAQYCPLDGEWAWKGECK